MKRTAGLSLASASAISPTSRTTGSTSKVVICRSIFPDSTLAMSRTPLISCSRYSPLVLIFSRRSFWCSFRGWISVRSRSPSEKPITAFSGVRSSWLMLARNSLLARLAHSASRLDSSRALLAASSSAVYCLQSVPPPACDR